MRACEAALAALYLRGGENRQVVERRRWLSLSRALRRRSATLETVANCARQEGFAQEATILDSGRILDWALRLIENGEALTALTPGYPDRWMKHLAHAAPPALWRIPGATTAARAAEIKRASSVNSVAIVGSRRISSSVRRFSKELGHLCATSGLTLYSGNAVGCDEAAMRGTCEEGGKTIGILPHGLNRIERVIPGAEYWSVCAPDEEFSRASAMERNALIYTSSPFSVIVHARLREGGTWHGALDAHRRKLTRLIARQDEKEPGNRALIALGAIPLIHSSGLLEAFDCKDAQPFLFD